MVALRTAMTALVVCSGLGCMVWGKNRMDQSKEIKQASFGVQTTFKQGQPLQFPDLQLVYLGQRQVKVLGDRLALREDFEVNRNGEKVAFSYGHGFPGDIGPAKFTIGNQVFLLEMVATESVKDPKAGRLKKDELILWRQEDFDQRVNHGR